MAVTSLESVTQEDDTDDLSLAFGDEIDILNRDLMEGDALEVDVDQLLSAINAVQQFGINRTSYQLLLSTQLLSGTAMAAIGAESLQQTGPDTAETDMALEGLLEKVSDKAAQWAAKIVHFTSTMTLTVLNGLGHLWSKISETVTSLTSKTWDASKAVGRTIKAHPYRTLAAVVLAAIAAVGVVAFVAAGVPSANADETAVKSFMNSVKDRVQAIHWPFGKITTEVADTGGKLVCHVPAPEGATAVTVTESGWTQTAVKSISGQLSKMWSSLRSTLGTIGTKVAAYGKIANDFNGKTSGKIEYIVAGKSGSKFAGWISKQIVDKVVGTMVWGVIGVVYMLIKDIVSKAFRMVLETFHSLRDQPQTA